MLRNMKKKSMSWLLILTMIISLFGGAGVSRTARAEGNDTARLRILFTSDVHGQVANVDYEKGAALFANGSLAKCNTLMKQARAEVPAGNTLQFDLGDDLYDYTTDYIYSADEKEIQPIYQAVAEMGYDAITLGNHEFDYTLQYLKYQLDSAGLTDKVVLSNVRDANTGQNIWAKNRIIQRTLTTAGGGSVTVNVGLIGVTAPVLSKKRTNYAGILTVDDIVASATQQARDLKAAGADIVLVLAHSGVGSETPANMDNNCGYALTKIPEVDVVLCGHKHSFFCADGTTEYDKLPGVDTGTGLVNGKNLVQVKNRGAGIGVVDLDISGEGGAAHIVGRQSSLRKVTAQVEADPQIVSKMDKWTNTFLSDCTEILCDMSSDTRLQNYFGNVEDNGAVSLLNDIKISYGLQYINNEDTSLAGLPVVAASSYLRYGSGDGNDYVDISGEFKRSDIYNLIDYKTGLYVYKMTGAQIREWMEWTASYYETAGQNPYISPSKPATGSMIDWNYDSDKSLQPVFQDQYATDWSNFFVFDGLEYTIDTTRPARYNTEGKKISDSQRITSLTRDGQAVTDDQTFVVVGHRMPAGELGKALLSTKLDSTSTAAYRKYIEHYIDNLSLTGVMKNYQDNNWKVNFSGQQNYLLHTGIGSSELPSTPDWIDRILEENEGYVSYLAHPDQKDTKDVTGPNLNVVSLNEDETNRNVTLKVQATDISGIRNLVYLPGKYSADSSLWGQSYAVENGTISATQNGTYSVLAEDGVGNRSIRYIRIDNIDQSILEAPKCAGFTNKKTKVTGTAEPGATLYVDILGGSKYSTTVKTNGTFSCKIGAQKADTKLFVYVVDGAGRASARTKLTVKRKGPNKPVLAPVKVASKRITATLNDTNTYPVFIMDNTVYLDKDGVEDLYKKSSLYKSSYKVVKLKTNVESEKLVMRVTQFPKVGQKATLYCLDAASRVSLASGRTIVDTVPDRATVDPLTNVSRKINLYSDEKCKQAMVKIQKKKYVTKKAKYVSSLGLYRYTISIPRTDSTETIRAYLINKNGKSKAVKVKTSLHAPDAPTVDKVKKGDKVITGKVDLVKTGSQETVTVSNSKTKVYVYVNKKKFKALVSEDGHYEAAVHKVPAGAKITVKAKNANGSSLKTVVYASKN